MIRITKQELLDAVSCNENHHYKLIEKHWPTHWKTMTIITFIKKARKLGVSDFRTQFIIWVCDNEGWWEAQKHRSGQGVNTVVDAYLELLGGADND